MAAGGLLRREPDDSLGTRAERHVFERLRAALPPEYTMLSNIAWLVRSHGVEREGEADLVIAHPELGFLAVEVKAGQIRRDSQGRWWAGVGQLDRSPFQQAADSHHSLVAKLKEHPAWQAGLEPIAGHAVAFPNVDLASLDAKILMGTDTDPELILDKTLLSPDPQRNRKLRISPVPQVQRALELSHEVRRRTLGSRPRRCHRVCRAPSSRCADVSPAIAAAAWRHACRVRAARAPAARSRTPSRLVVPRRFASGNARALPRARPSPTHAPPP
jgi:hypothetical protein